MNESELDLNLGFLDHVAIRVADMETSIAWYQKVLNLKKYRLEKWGDFPIFMLSGKSGIALFPANLNDPKMDPTSKNVRIDHFAFNVNRETFDMAVKKYKALNLEYHIQDHFYFDSVYTKDPDGHTVELTIIKVDEDKFYV